MRYVVHVDYKDDEASRLAHAMRGRRNHCSVYVVGVTDEHALADILAKGSIDPTNYVGKLPFVEAIGTTDGNLSENDLRALAEKRVAQLEAKGGSQ